MKILVTEDPGTLLRRRLQAAVSAQCPMMAKGEGNPMTAEGGCQHMTDTGDCQMMEAQAACVHKTGDKMSAAVEISAPVGDKGSAGYGYKWRVQVIKYGMGSDGRINWPRGPLVAALPLFNKSRVFMVSDSQHQDPQKQPAFGKPVKELQGWLDNAVDTGTGIEADFNVLTSATKLRSDLLDSFERGNPTFLGLSVDVDGLSVKKTVAGKTFLEPVKIIAVQTDVVYDPTNEGKFLKMVAAVKADQKEDSMFGKLLAALKTQRPDLAVRINALLAKGDSVTDEDISSLMAAAMPGTQTLDIEKLVAALKTTGETGSDTVIEDARKLIGEARLVACATTLSTELSGCDLPAAVKDKLTAAFSGKVFEAADLQAAIKTEKETLDKLSAAGLFSGAGVTRVDVQGEPERLQAAMDKLMGVDVDAQYADVPAFGSLRAGYTRITGDTNVTGQVAADHVSLGEKLMGMMKLSAAYSSSSFSFVLGNSLYRRLAKIYQALNYNEDILVSFFRNATDFKAMEIIQIGYFGDLADVNPESGDYQEIVMPTDVEASYAINQKGNIISITRKVMVNDDLKSVQRLIDGLGRAARRTYAKRIWNKLINNATYKGDSVALFDAQHGNLGATALTNDATGVATLTARLQAMYAQTEPDSGEGLGLEAQYLAVPRELLEVAKGLNSAWPGVAGGNPHAGRFGTNHERIITNPLFTDATDWYLIGDKNAVEMIEVAHLNGQREPELFVADNPAVGAMFLSDKIQYKIRHEYEAEIADYRGFDKSVVAA